MCFVLFPDVHFFYCPTLCSTPTPSTVIEYVRQGFPRFEFKSAKSSKAYLAVTGVQGGRLWLIRALLGEERKLEARIWLIGAEAKGRGVKGLKTLVAKKWVASSMRRRDHLEAILTKSNLLVLLVHVLHNSKSHFLWCQFTERVTWRLAQFGCVSDDVDGEVEIPAIAHVHDHRLLDQGSSLIGSGSKSSVNGSPLVLKL